MIPLDQRVEAAQVAASLGVFSSAALVEMYSAIADDTDPSDLEGTVGGRLRKAFAGGDYKSRVDVMHDLWDEAKNPVDRHARLILTATAAARIPPSDAYGDRIADLVASMMTAGLDQQAARWGGVIDGSGDDRAWSILAVGSAPPALGRGMGSPDRRRGIEPRRRFRQEGGRRQGQAARRGARRPRPPPGSGRLWRRS